MKLIYCLTHELHDEAVDDARRFLSDDERQRSARFRFDRHRRDYVVAHALLRRMVSEHRDIRPADCRFVTAATGKPALADDPGLTFSLTHTDGLVACAVADGHPVGVDAEPVDRDVSWTDLARQFFAPTEIAQLEACPADRQRERFLELWTLKEAYLKATGEGLSSSLSAVVFSYDGPHGLRLHLLTPDASAGWRVALYALPGYRLALALHGLGAEPVEICRAPDATSAPVPAALPPVRCTARPDPL